MGCYNGKVKFSQATIQSELLSILKSEKALYKNEISAMTKRYNDSITSATILGDQNKAIADKKKTEDSLKETPYKHVLEEFVSGIEEFEAELNTKVFSDFEGLKEKMQFYFNLADDREQKIERVKTEREALKQWLKTHVKTS